ncbi:MAG: ATPase [Bacteroidetes bacterium GWF2_40_14]|nr:MAG: ATPase [Bacteroidetes bacterium GWF2_40_14]
MYSVTADNLEISYGTVKALRGVSFQVSRGEMFGLIGPDGAGKTSLFRILTTLLLADAGSATVDGFDVVKDYKEIRGRVGYMPGKFSLYQDLSVEENLEFFATLFNTTIKENYHLIKDIYRHIEPFKTRKAGALSGGMKQKLALSCALIHKPSVLFLDEPTTGVDPVSRKEFWEMLKRLKQQNITIIVSTPYMDEAIICDRIALINEGKFMQIETPQNIISAFGKKLFAVTGDNMSRLLNDVREMDIVSSAFAFGDEHHVTLRNPMLDHTDIEAGLLEKGCSNIFVKEINAGIEDCYMALSQ